MENTRHLTRTNLPLFLGVAFVGAWLVALPLWLTDRSIESPILGITAGVMMATPTVAVVISWLVARRRGMTFRGLLRGLGLGLGSRKRRTVAVGIALWIGIPLFVLLATLASAALGLYELDITGLSLFRAQMDKMSGSGNVPASSTLALLIFGGQVLITPLLNAIPCLGEELGWRGWLLPRLLPYGRLRAVAISGAIWGLWHAPVTLLGYNYAELGAWAALMFVPFCMLFGAVLSWTRLATGSVWPAVIGHGALNGSTILVMLVGAGTEMPNMALVGPVGVVGMTLLAVTVFALYRFASPPQAVSLGEGAYPTSEEGTVEIDDGQPVAG